MIESFKLEGFSEGDLVQLPCSEQRHLELDQAVQSPMQLALECFQR